MDSAVDGLEVKNIGLTLKSKGVRRVAEPDRWEEAHADAMVVHHNISVVVQIHVDVVVVVVVAMLLQQSFVDVAVTLVDIVTV